jgi:Ca-activated chloride channel family protein
MRIAKTFKPIGTGGPTAATLVLILLLGSQSDAQTQNALSSPSRDSSIKVDVDLVLLPVTVADKTGRPFTGLKTENFRIYDNGIEQRVHHFSTEDLPFSMGLVLDRSGSMTMVIDEVYQAAFHTIRASKPADEFFIHTFNHRVERRQDFSTDRKLLEKRLKGVSAGGQTALYDAVFIAIEHVKTGSHDKKALLVVTDGADNSSRITFHELLDQVRQEKVAIYVVGLFGMAELYVEDPMDVTLLTQLAEATGGKAYFPRTMKECEQACIAIAEELRQQYSLGYYPEPRKRDGSWHTVQVQLQLLAELPSAGLKARTRAGYFAPKDQ